MFYSGFASGKNSDPINETVYQVKKNEVDLETTKKQVTDLEREVEHLSIVTEAMWVLLKDMGGLSNELLDEKMKDVIQSKNSNKLKRVGCKKCARIVTAAHGKCIYCGGELIGTRNSKIF